MSNWMQGAMQGAQAGSAFGPWGAAIGGVAGGIMGSKGGGTDDLPGNLANMSLQFQKDLALNGVRFRVEDAKRAGIHPALALGMQPANFTPVSVGGQSRDESDLSWMRNAGHDISRAIDSTRTTPEREHARAMAALQVEHAGLSNDLLRSQIARLQRDQVGPAFPDPWSANPGGHGDAPRVTPKAMEPIVTGEGRPHSEPGPVSDVGYARTTTGYVPVPSKDFKERTEDNIIQEVNHFLRNNLLPRFAGGARNEPPLSALPVGAYGWNWNPVRMEWQPKFPRKDQDMRGRTIRLAD